MRPRACGCRPVTVNIDRILSLFPCVILFFLIRNFCSLQEVVCSAEGCGSRVHDPCEHDTCRRHAPCSVFSEGNLLWHGDRCDACYRDLEDAFYSEGTVDEERSKSAKARLRKWVQGFGKNKSPGTPYIASEDY